MTNKGIAAEWDLDRILTAKGYDVARNAASHGKFDLLVDHHPTGKEYRIECKTTAAKALYLGKDARESIRSLSLSSEKMGFTALLCVCFGGAHRDRLGRFLPVNWEVFPACIVCNDVARKGEGKSIEEVFG